MITYFYDAENERLVPAMDALPNFVEVSQYAETATYHYFGAEPSTGWLINRCDTSGNKTVATESNNSGTEDLSTAWTNRLTLTYA